MYLIMCTDWKLAKWSPNQQNWKYTKKLTYILGIYTIFLVHVKRLDWHMYFSWRSGEEISIDVFFLFLPWYIIKDLPIVFALM